MFLFISLKLVPKKFKNYFIFLLFFIFFGMLIETAGLGLIIPLFTIISDSNFSFNYPRVYQFINDWSVLNFLKDTDVFNSNQSFFIVSSVVFFLIFYFFRVIFLIYLSWFQNSFTWKIYRDLSNFYFKNYLNQPFEKILKKNTSEIIRNLAIQLEAFNTSINSTIFFITETLIVLGILALLVYFEPIGSIIIFIFFLILSLIFYSSTKNIILKLGKERQINKEAQVKDIQQTFGNIKNVILSGKIKNIFEEYTRKVEKISTSGYKHTFIQSFPRLFLEMIAVSSLCILIIVLLLNSKNESSVMPILILFGAASFRVIPSFNRLLIAVGHIKYNHSTILNLIEEKKNFVSANNLFDKTYHSLKFDKIISLKDVSFQYEVGNQVLEKINLEINKGRMIGFVGTSGVGKSTLIDLILGFLKPSSGEIFVDNKDIHSNINGWYKMIGYVPQQVFLKDESIKKNIALGCRDDEIDYDKVDEVIKLAQLDDFVNSLEKGYDTVVGERGARISGGQLQRIGIARALYNNPSIIIFDEATSSLDIETESEILKSIENFKKNKTILIISHRNITLKNCDETYKIENKKLTLN